MERIILASCNKGDFSRPFAGCGTSLVAAQQLGRQWIGIDISPTAVRLIKLRMEKVGASSSSSGCRLPRRTSGAEALRVSELGYQRFNGTHSPRKSGDMGIDGFSFLHTCRSR